MPYLIQNPETPSEKKFDIKLGINTIGRGVENSICIEDLEKSLSRNHIVIEYTEESATIEDISTNGTRVNDDWLNRQVKRKLANGDLISCGNFKFKFVGILNDNEPEPDDNPTIIKEISPDRTRIAMKDLLSQELQEGQSSVLLLREQDSSKRDRDKLKVLLDLSRQLSSPDNANRLSEKILDLLFEIMKVDRAIILKLIDRKTQELECKALKSRRDRSEPQNFYSKRIVKDVLENGKSILTADALRDIGSDSILMQSIRSAMCVPLKPRDEVIGVLYVDNLSKDNIYTEEDLEFLTALANQAAIAIDNMQLHKQILEDVVARHEMEIGRKIQRDFLPDTMPQLPGWEFAATFTPATQVSGDFYDFFTLPSGDIGLAIGDVSEHGVGSALFMALFRSLIRVFSTNTYLDNGSSESPEITQNETQPSELNFAHVNALRAVSLTNDYVAKTHNSKPDSNYYFATLFFGVLDPVTGTLTYINAGHEPPLVVINQNGIKTLLESTTKVVIGTSPNRKFSIQQIHLEIGDILMGCTDGVPDAKSSSGNRFTKEKLSALLGEYCKSAQATLDLVEKKVKEHVGDAERFDDITMLAIYRRPVQ